MVSGFFARRATMATSVIVALFFFAGCKVEPPKPPLVETVAVLPFDNESNNLDAADFLQAYVYLALKPSAYKVMGYKEVNSFLEKAGISDGGQLGIVDPVKLGKDLGVHALLYGNVESFGYLNVGYYTQRKVSLDLKLVDVSNGTTLWENSQTAATRNFTLDSKQAQQNLAKGLAEQMVEKAAGMPLEEESRQAVTKTLSTLPGFYFNGFAVDPDVNDQFKRGAKNIIKDIIRKSK